MRYHPVFFVLMNMVGLPVTLDGDQGILKIGNFFSVNGREFDPDMIDRIIISAEEKILILKSE